MSRNGPTQTEIAEHYRALGLQPGASRKEVRQAYRRLARKHHPDLAPEGERAEARRRMAAINAAHSALRDYVPPPPDSTPQPGAAREARSGGAPAQAPRVITMPPPAGGIAAVPNSDVADINYSPEARRSRRRWRRTTVQAAPDEAAPTAGFVWSVRNVLGVALPVIGFASVLCLVGALPAAPHSLADPAVRVGYLAAALAVSLLLVGLPLGAALARHPKIAAKTPIIGAALLLLAAGISVFCARTTAAQANHRLALWLSKPGLLLGHGGSREAAIAALDGQAGSALEECRAATARSGGEGSGILPERARNFVENVEEGARLLRSDDPDPEPRRKEHPDQGEQSKHKGLKSASRAKGLAAEASVLRGYSPRDGVLAEAVRRERELTASASTGAEAGSQSQAPALVPPRSPRPRARWPVGRTGGASEQRPSPLGRRMSPATGAGRPGRQRPSGGQQWAFGQQVGNASPPATPQGGSAGPPVAPQPALRGAIPQQHVEPAPVRPHLPPPRPIPKPYLEPQLDTQEGAADSQSSREEKPGAASEGEGEATDAGPGVPDEPPDHPLNPENMGTEDGQP